MGHPYAYIDKTGNRQWSEANREGDQIVGHDGIALEAPVGKELDEVGLRGIKDQPRRAGFFVQVPADSDADALYHTYNWAAFLSAAFTVYRNELTASVDEAINRINAAQAEEKRRVDRLADELWGSFAEAEKRGARGSYAWADVARTAIRHFEGEASDA